MIFEKYTDHFILTLSGELLLELDCNYVPPKEFFFAFINHSWALSTPYPIKLNCLLEDFGLIQLVEFRLQPP